MVRGYINVGGLLFEFILGIPPRSDPCHKEALG